MHPDLFQLVFSLGYNKNILSSTVAFTEFDSKSRGRKKYMTKVLTWNVGCFKPVEHLKTYKGYAVKKQQFQHFNGTFVSDTIRQIDPDIIFLLEITDADDLDYIAALEDYPYRHLTKNTYHTHHILTASKTPYDSKDYDGFTIVQQGGMTYVPVHLGTFHAADRLGDAKKLTKLVAGKKHVAIMGDTNMWSRGSIYAFKADREAYKVLTATHTDLTRTFHSTTRFLAGLDKVFVGKDFTHAAVEVPKIHGTFMDHYPLVIELQK